MKAFFLICSFIAFGLSCYCQDKAGSQISLALKKKDTIYKVIQSDAIFTLNGSTQEFHAMINLFPIVPNPDIKDSLAENEKPLHLQVTGRFPVRNMGFLTVNDNNKTYGMDCLCGIYDSSRHCSLNFNLSILEDRPPVQDITGAPFYQPRLSFAMVLIPADYGLDKEPFSIYEPVMIIVKDVQINKVQ